MDKAEMTKQGLFEADNDDIEIDVVEMLYRLLEKWKLIAVGAILGILIMGIYSFVIAKPVYEATSKLYVLASSDSVVNLSDLQIGSYLTSDYVEVFDTWEVHEMVRSNLGLELTDQQMSDMLTIENPSNTRILYITVAHKDPEKAALIANEYAKVSKLYISEVMLTDEPSVLSEAQVPKYPVSPRKKLNLALGMIAGIFIMCAGIVVQFLTDDKIRSEEDVRRYTSLSTLAVVPNNDEVEKGAKNKAARASARQKRGQ
ncbi:MAG: polysaccharide export protein [Clostridia bacterium]|nr:polysaccharide export protein [Clostridia bacterium]MBQ9855180.1 polysaccharide export protein [Clostridia bacterium]